ncbi:MAG: hypothetical protein O6826_02600, partial [Acidobacteria bacterium]|nr:hypothetical protein [Acidobacteriota bacterium]
VTIDADDIVAGLAIEDLEFDTHIVTVEDGAWAVAAVLAEFVASLRTTILTPGSNPPLVSVTNPIMVPVPVCAQS